MLVTGIQREVRRSARVGPCPTCISGPHTRTNTRPTGAVARSTRARSLRPACACSFWPAGRPTRCSRAARGAAHGRRAAAATRGSGLAASSLPCLVTTFGQPVFRHGSLWSSWRPLASSTALGRRGRRSALRHARWAAAVLAPASDHTGNVGCRSASGTRPAAGWCPRSWRASPRAPLDPKAEARGAGTGSRTAPVNRRHTVREAERWGHPSV